MHSDFQSLQELHGISPEYGEGQRTQESGSPASAAQVAPSVCRARDSQASLRLCSEAATNTRWPDSPEPPGDSVHQGQHLPQVAMTHTHPTRWALCRRPAPWGFGLGWWQGVKFHSLQNLFQLLVKSTLFTNTVSFSAQSANVYRTSAPWRTLSYKKTHEQCFCPPGIFSLCGRHQIRSGVNRQSKGVMGHACGLGHRS